MYAAAKPEPVPAATSIRVSRAGMRKRRPTSEPLPPPNWMIDPSRPMEPPVQSATSEAALLSSTAGSRI